MAHLQPRAGSELSRQRVEQRTGAFDQTGFNEFHYLRPICAAAVRFLDPRHRRRLRGIERRVLIAAQRFAREQDHVMSHEAHRENRFDLAAPQRMTRRAQNARDNPT